MTPFAREVIVKLYWHITSLRGLFSENALFNQTNLLISQSINPTRLITASLFFNARERNSKHESEMDEQASERGEANEE